MKYEKIVYPDGQLSVKITDFTDRHIRERINSYNDLIFILSIVECCKSNGYEDLTIFIPSLFGQRSDRRFSENQSFDLKIICNLINSCNFKEVLILDPHSEVSLALINNSKKISSFDYIQRAVDRIDINRKDRGNPLVLVSPDSGSYKKCFEYGEKLNLPVVAAVKHRDLDGKVDLTFMGDVKDKDCLIVDDLGDGCYTFLVLADRLRKQGARKVYLYISHGFFSKGFGELVKVIDHIYCTNSVKDIDTTNKDLLEVYPFLPNLLTQFKII